MDETPRCDLHGPYTGEQAAALVLGAWKPERTGYLCASCRELVAVHAEALAASIDAHALDAYERGLIGN